MPIERALHATLTGALVTLIGLVGACDRGHQQAPPPPKPAQPAPREPAKSCTLTPIPTKVAGNPKLVVAIGDLHGDLGGTRAALKAAGAIDANDKWIGGELVVVQTGDILDRGDDESKIVELLDKLSADAKAAGGDLIYLLGNHELMNAAADFRYVTPGGMKDFSGDRQHALAPGGAWAKRFAQHNVIAIVGDSVLSHAGVLPDWLTHIDDTNLSARCWLDGQSLEPAAALTSDDSPVWNRDYGIPDKVDCSALKGVLDKLGAKRMIVGHTVQEAGITSACEGALWRIDVGLAKMYGGPIQVLAIEDGVAKIVTGVR
jgi:hypothetical protein